MSTMLMHSAASSPRASDSSDHSIYLLCSLPGSTPRASQPTPQRLIHVAASLSIHLSNADLPHAFLGRFSLFLRGANVNPRWVDADVVKPIIGGTQRIKDCLALHPDLKVHSEVVEEGVDRLLVSHKCGIYVRLSVGSIQSIKKKTNLISAHPNPNLPAVFLPCLTPARQFLETVIIASSEDPKSEDLQDLIWMKDNLRMDIMSDPTTLKKTWEEGRVGKLIDTWPVLKEVFVDLGLVIVNEDFSL
ncbi:10672_t:CDS:2, partial [Acaulospora colombiana]